MPTHNDETLHDRYTREHLTHLARLATMTPDQIAAMELDLHNALAEVDRLRAQKSSQGGEAVEAVAYGDKQQLNALKSECSASCAVWNVPGRNREPLMTVAQHNRIVADVRANRDAVLKVMRAKEMLPKCAPSPGGVELGDVDALIAGRTVSVDVSSGDDDYGRRIFATVIGVQEDESEGFVILCDDPNYNHTPSPDAELVALLREWSSMFSGGVADGPLMRLRERTEARLAEVGK